MLSKAVRDRGLRYYIRKFIGLCMKSIEIHGIIITIIFEGVKEAIREKL